MIQRFIDAFNSHSCESRRSRIPRPLPFSFLSVTPLAPTRSSILSPPSSHSTFKDSREGPRGDSRWSFSAWIYIIYKTGFSRCEIKIGVAPPTSSRLRHRRKRVGKRKKKKSKCSRKTNELAPHCSTCTQGSTASPAILKYVDVTFRNTVVVNLRSETLPLEIKWNRRTTKAGSYRFEGSRDRGHCNV